jgi:hypothetical protein
MAHVHGAAKAANNPAAADHAVAKGAGKLMEHAGHMMDHAGHLMSGPASSMKDHAGHMMDHAGHMMASMPKATATVATGAAMAGGAVAATSHSGSSFMSFLAKHPLVVFGLGVAAGYYIHKYRKEIVSAATQATERGKDFVLHQKENLEDLVAECHECEEESGKPQPD